MLSIIRGAFDALQSESPVQTLGLTALAANESTLANPQPWLSDIFGGTTGSTGKVVNPHTALRVTAVYACVSALAQPIAQTPCVFKREKSDGSLVDAVDHPLYKLLLRLPTPEMTAQEETEMSMNHLLLRGNAYRQIVRSGGEIVEINPLHPDFIRMFRSNRGELRYEYQDPWGGSAEFAQRDVWRTIGKSFNGLVGVSPITYAREAIGLAMATEEHGAKLFSNGAQIATALEHPGVMSEDAANRLKASIEDRYSGSRNAFKTILLEEGIKVNKLSLNNVDSQFIEARKFQIEEICRMFNVPAHKIQHLDRATFNNIEHLGMDFTNTSLMPWFGALEATGFRDLLLPSEQKKYVITHDTTHLTRGDTAALVNMIASGIANTWLSPNEGRKMMGLNPRDGGDKYENPNTSSGKTKPGEPIADPAKG